MTTAASRSALLLGQGGLLRIRAQPGGSVRCVRGLVWLTQENDPNDRIVSAGETFRFDRAGTALVNALGSDAALALSHGLDHDHARPSVHRTLPVSVGEEIARLCTRFDPQWLAQLPPAVRNEMVQREARRMRAHVLWLLLQQARRTAAASLAIAGAFVRKAFLRRPSARRGRVEPQQGV